jgi:hypothetical protein
VLLFYAGAQGLRGIFPSFTGYRGDNGCVGPCLWFSGAPPDDPYAKNRALWMDAEEKKRAIQNERMRAIYELTSTLSSTLSYKRVLDSALDMSATALNPDPEELTSDPLVGAVMFSTEENCASVPRGVLPAPTCVTSSTARKAS